MKQEREEYAVGRGERVVVRQIPDYVVEGLAAIAAGRLCKERDCVRKAAVVQGQRIVCRLHAARTPLERRQVMLEEAKRR